MFTFNTNTLTLTIDEYTLHNITAALNNCQPVENLSDDYLEILETSITYQNFYKLSIFERNINSKNIIGVFKGILVYVEDYINLELEYSNKGLRIPDNIKLKIFKINQIKIIPIKDEFNSSLVLKWEQKLNNIIQKLSKYVEYIRGLESEFSAIDNELHKDAGYTCQ